jgi:hypothetical protein
VTTATGADSFAEAVAAIMRLPLTDAEVRRRMEEAERELAKMEAEIPAAVEEERRTGQPVRADWRGKGIDEVE